MSNLNRRGRAIWDRRLPAGPLPHGNAPMAEALAATGAGWQPAVPGQTFAHLIKARKASA